MEILDKISSRSARVGVAGLGYVGLPLLAAFHRAGFTVLGFDTDLAKIDTRGVMRHVKGRRDHIVMA